MNRVDLPAPLGPTSATISPGAISSDFVYLDVAFVVAFLLAIFAVLFGTRRVGPDLSREAARRSNDWHIAHFFKPRAVAPLSVMPEYTWFFDANGVPNRDGMALITYMQWLGSWLDHYPYYQGEGPAGPGPAEKVNMRGI